MPYRNSEEFLENLSLYDENLLQEYLETGNLSTETISRSISERNIFPCFFSSALKLDGIDEFIDILEKYTCEKAYGSNFGARIFKISEDEQGNRLTHLKVTGGNLRVKTTINYNFNGNLIEEKINQIRIYSGKKYQTAESVDSGTVCAVTGLTKTYSGEGLGTETDSESPLLEPVLTYKLLLPEEPDTNKGLNILRRLEEEDPQLHVIWNEHLHEIHIQLMGEIQLEILKSIIKDRFGLKVEFVNGSIAYRETIENTVEGVGHYEPLRHYAEVHLLMEPGKPGSGLVFAADCREEILNKAYRSTYRVSHNRYENYFNCRQSTPKAYRRRRFSSGYLQSRQTRTAFS